MKEHAKQYFSFQIDYKQFKLKPKQPQTREKVHKNNEIILMIPPDHEVEKS